LPHDGDRGRATQSTRVFVLKMLRMLKVLVTGADGFTGAHFVKQAREAGYDVFAFDGDLTNPHAVQAQVDAAAPDVVVHLAGISFVGHDKPSAFYDVNVIGTLNLLDALLKLPHRPKRILLASSANVYGNCEQSPISEIQAPAPLNHYAMSKLAMEHLAMTYADRLPLFFVRPFNYTGPGQVESFVIPKIVSHFKRQATTIELGNLTVEREYNDVRMVTDAYLKLLDKAAAGEIYNICSGKTYTLHQVIDALVELTGHQMNVVVNPAFVRANELHRLCGDVSKLHKTIGTHDPIALQNTLRWMLESS
jgi:nucleoside-diphosphate-sugar epimerase